MIVQLAWLYEAFFVLDLGLGLAWTASSFTAPHLQEALVYLGFISSLAPIVHTIALGRALMVRRLVVMLPLFALSGEAFYRLVLSPMLLREIEQVSPGIPAEIAAFGLSNHPTALFFGLALSMVGLFVYYPLYRRLIPLFESEEE